MHGEWSMDGWRVDEFLPKRIPKHNYRGKKIWLIKKAIEPRKLLNGIILLPGCDSQGSRISGARGKEEEAIADYCVIWYGWPYNKIRPKGLFLLFV